MNVFINQGRCRICGKMFCCSKHQKEHEKQQHKESAHILEHLPTTCKKCCQYVYTVYELRSSCQPLVKGHLTNENFTNSTDTLNKPNRKRTLNQVSKHVDYSKLAVFSEHQRKKLIPNYKFKSVNIEKWISNDENDQQTFFFEFSHIVMDSKSVLSPQLNLSYKMLANSIIKSSTPLNEQENETPSPISQNENLKKYENLTRTTPESFQSPIIIISAKKSTPPGIISNFSKRMSKNVLKNRKVTFEIVEKSENKENLTVYNTSTLAIEVIKEIDECINTDSKNRSDSSRNLVIKIMEKMRNVLNGIPHSISQAWDWSNQKFKRSKSNEEKCDDELRSPLKKRPRYGSDDLLTRKPITSYWVNMSVNSLFRKPLPTYVHKYSNDVENFHH